jgi:hypothetical protein
MTSANVLNLTDDQFRVLYEVLTDVHPLVKDPEPAFIELFDYVTEEYELNHVEYELTSVAKAFLKVYSDQGLVWMSQESKEWREFKEAYDRMSELGFIAPESVL